MPTVVAVHASDAYSFTKEARPEIELVAGLGVRGDMHMGAQVRHRSRVAADPTQPNLRQVHLIHTELFDLVAEKGFLVTPGDLGENITTSGVDLLGLPVGSVLRVGEEALLALTGLRNPCRQIDNFQDGLLGAVLNRDESGSIVRLAGVMAVVVRDGVVRPGDQVEVSLPPAHPAPWTESEPPTAARRPAGSIVRSFVRVRGEIRWDPPGEFADRLGPPRRSPSAVRSPTRAAATLFVAA